MNTFITRESKIKIADLPEKPPLYFTHYTVNGKTAETASEAARIYKEAYARAIEEAVECEDQKTAQGIIIDGGIIPTEKDFIYTGIPVPPFVRVEQLNRAGVWVDWYTGNQREKTHSKYRTVARFTQEEKLFDKVLSRVTPETKAQVDAEMKRIDGEQSAKEYPDVIKDMTELMARRKNVCPTCLQSLQSSPAEQEELPTKRPAQDWKRMHDRIWAICQNQEKEIQSLKLSAENQGDQWGELMTMVKEAMNKKDPGEFATEIQSKFLIQRR